MTRKGGTEMPAKWLELDAVKFSSGKKEAASDPVVMEYDLSIMLGDELLATLACTPADLEDLVRGHLITSGLAGRFGAIEVDVGGGIASVERVFVGDDKRGLEARRSGMAASAPRGDAPMPRVSSGLRLKSSEILALMASFQEKCEGFRITGGLHSAALADQEKILVFREDIGRHNAIDKAVGWSVSQGIGLDNAILLTTGRIFTEIVRKAAMAGIPVIVSKGAVTDGAVRLASGHGITVIGYAREGRMNVYCGADRVV